MKKKEKTTVPDIEVQTSHPGEPPGAGVSESLGDAIRDGAVCDVSAGESESILLGLESQCGRSIHKSTNVSRDL